MDRRCFLKGVGFGLGSLVLAGCGQSIAKAGKNVKPNIVLIMADDLGYRELGCYGQKKIATPNIDRIAKEGMKFTDFYSGSTVCAPARCNLMTGMHGGHAYIRNNGEIKNKGMFGGQTPLPAETVTIASVLKKDGYATGAFGKWGLGRVDSTGDPLEQGFDRFFGYNCQRHAHNLYPRFLVDDKKEITLEGNTRGVTGEKYAPQVIADEMLDFVRQNKDKPFFLYYPTVIPHLALQAPQEDIDVYKGRWPETPYTGKSYQPHPTPKACYAAMISFMDKQVGRLMELLAELDLDDNTIVFFTSDNGATHMKAQVDYEFFQSVGELRGLKGSLYEGGIRVPMIARWPGKIKADSVTNHIAANYDIFETIAEIIGETGDVETDSTSFVPTLMSQPNKQKIPEYLFWDFTGRGGQLAVRMGDHKAIKQNLMKNPDAKLEIYNLKDDPSEKNNIVDKEPKLAAKFETIMLEARTEPEVEKFRFGRYGSKK